MLVRIKNISFKELRSYKKIFGIGILVILLGFLGIYFLSNYKSKVITKPVIINNKGNFCELTEFKDKDSLALYDGGYLVIKMKINNEKSLLEKLKNNINLRRICAQFESKLDNKIINMTPKGKIVNEDILINAFTDRVLKEMNSIKSCSYSSNDSLKYNK